MHALDGFHTAPPDARVLLLAMEKITQHGGSSAQDAKQRWQQVEQLFDLPASRQLPYSVVDTFVSVMSELKRPLGSFNYQQGLKRLNEALKAQTVVPLETAREIASPECAV